MKTTILLIGLLLLGTMISAQEDLDSNYAFYEGATLSYLMEAPDDWVLNLDEAHADGLSACFFPEGMTYFDNKLSIKVWIFKLDSLSFDEFITGDTAYHSEEMDGIEFARSKTINITDNLDAIIFHTQDPGAYSSLAAVAYIDAVTEIVIYELHIAARQYDMVSQVKFKEALETFSFVK